MRRRFELLLPCVLVLACQVREGASGAPDASNSRRGMTGSGGGGGTPTATGGAPGGAGGGGGTGGAIDAGEDIPSGGGGAGDAGRDAPVGTDTAVRDARLELIIIGVGGSGGAGGGAGGSGGSGIDAGADVRPAVDAAACAQLQSDYAAALTEAKRCTRNGNSPACQHLVASALGCSSCMVHVDDSTMLDKIQAAWDAARCPSSAICTAAIIICLPATTATCVATDGGDGVCVEATLPL